MDTRSQQRLIDIANSLLKSGESQQDMCDRVGLKRSKWLGWAQGRKPSGDGYWQLAKALSSHEGRTVTVVDLMKRIEGLEDASAPPAPNKGGSAEETARWLTAENLREVVKYWEDPKELQKRVQVINERVFELLLEKKGDRP